MLSVRSKHVMTHKLGAIYKFSRFKNSNSSDPIIDPVSLFFFPPLFLFFFLLYIFSNSHTLNIHRCPPHPTSCLLFTPLNSYSVCFIILHTRTSRSLVSYSWNNVLTGGYTVCIFTALMYVQFAFICKYNGYSIKTRDDNNH